MGNRPTKPSESSELSSTRRDSDEERHRACGNFSFLKSSHRQEKRSTFLPVWNPDDDDDDDDERTEYYEDEVDQDEEDNTGGSCFFLGGGGNKSPSSEEVTCSTSTSTLTGSGSNGSRNRILSKSSSWLSFSNNPSETNDPYTYTEDELELSDADAVNESDLTACQSIWIVTTAALPWMTGTAINPLLRAAYLSNHFNFNSGSSNTDAEEDEEDAESSSSSRPNIHLVLPWLDLESDRVQVYGESWRRTTCPEQELYIRNWLLERNIGQNLDALNIHWYPARYHKSLGSIFAISNICELCCCSGEVPTALSNNSICILEEPEHLNYYRGNYWRQQFKHVIGIIHTNYGQYAHEEFSTLGVGKYVTKPLIGAISSWMVRAYCDKVIQLSATLPEYAPEKEVVCNVHGVRDEFFQECQSGDGIYFLGKLLWAKGLDKLLDLQYKYKHATGQFFPMDIYGSGPDQDDIQSAFEGKSTPPNNNKAVMIVSSASSSSLTTSSSKSSSMSMFPPSSRFDLWSKSHEAECLPVQFCGRVDHAQLEQQQQNGNDDESRNSDDQQQRKQRSTTGGYKIFVNPSITEVLCTVTAEAIAMGKFVIVPNHPSNTFFQQFTNCLQYNTDEEFIRNLQYAIQHQPKPLSSDERDALTWEGATERLISAAKISFREAARRDRLRGRDQRLADWHIQLGQGTKGDVIRKVLGAGPASKQTPDSTSSQNAATTNTNTTPWSSRSSLSRSSSDVAAEVAAEAAATTTATEVTFMPISAQC